MLLAKPGNRRAALAPPLAGGGAGDA
jgi:hypothetical protein